MNYYSHICKVIVPKNNVFFLIIYWAIFTQMCALETPVKMETVLLQCTSAPAYECQSEEGWFGTNCDVCK